MDGSCSRGDSAMDGGRLVQPQWYFDAAQARFLRPRPGSPPPEGDMRWDVAYQQWLPSPRQSTAVFTNCRFSGIRVAGERPVDNPDRLLTNRGGRPSSARSRANGCSKRRGVSAASFCRTDAGQPCANV